MYLTDRDNMPPIIVINDNTFNYRNIPSFNKTITLIYDFIKKP